VTQVRLALSAPTSDGTVRRPSGSVEWRPTKRRNVAGDVVLPAPFTVGLADPPPVIDVAPTEPGWAWQVVERVQGGSPRARYVTVPDSASVVDYADLVEVDPATLDPVTLSNAWWTQVTDYVAGGDFATHTDLTTGLAGKVNTSTYTAGLAGKQDKATLGADVVADATVRATFTRRRTAPPASLLRVPAPTTPTVLAGDDFAGAAGTSLAGRNGTLGTASPWTVVSGTWQLDGAGHVSPTAATDGILAVMTPPARTQTNYTVSMDVLISKSGSQSNQGALVFRYVDTSNFWYYQPPVSGGTDWRLYKVVGGSHTVVLQFGLPSKANGTTVNLRADVWGRDITVYLDGAEIYTATDTAGQSASTVGIRQGISGGYTTPIVVSNFKVTTYAGAKFNIPRLDAAAAQQLFPNGATGTWDASDDNNPNVTWDPVNHRWVLYYSGYTSATGTPTIQGMGLAYANSLDGPWTPDPANPVVPATTGNIENGGLVYVAGRWLRIEDIGGGAYTSPDLHTWTPLTMYGFPTNAGDPYMRVNENGLLECWYGVGIPATQIWRATSSDGGVTWDVPTAPVINVPSYLTLRGHGEPSVYVPPGKEGQEAFVFVDLIRDPAGHSYITAAVTVDGGNSWHWHQIVGASGSGFDAFQKFDSSPVVEDGVFHLFFCASPLPGGEVNLDGTIGRSSVQWTQVPDPSDVHPVPYQ
jgi:hypothetical protein